MPLPFSPCRFVHDAQTQTIVAYTQRTVVPRPRNKTKTYGGHFTCPCDLVTFMMGALRSLHSTCLSFLPSSTSFIMSDQSGRLLGRLRSVSSFFIFSCDGGFLAANTDPRTFCCGRSKRESRARARFTYDARARV